MTRPRLLMLAFVAAALAAGGWYVAEMMYLSKSRDLRSEILRADRRRTGAQEMLKSRAAWADRRDALGETMIAGAPDEFEHTLRAGLAQVATAAGLADVSSGNGRPIAAASPVARRAGRDLGPRLRAKPDFLVTHAWLSGDGDLESVLTALAMLRAQPWAHRIEGFTIKPANRKRTTFRVRIDLASISMDSIPRTNAGLPEITAVSDDTLAELAAVIGANPFGAHTAVAEAPPPAPVSPSGPPYSNWRITGLIEGERVEALLVNQRSGERRVVLPGGRVLDATFESGQGERAVFVIDGHPHEVRVGDTLDQRRPAPNDQNKQAVQARAEEATP